MAYWRVLIVPFGHAAAASRDASKALPGTPGQMPAALTGPGFARGSGQQRQCLVQVVLNDAAHERPVREVAVEQPHWARDEEQPLRQHVQR